MINKKGLSDIVTMVLIILLVLIAIGIIWFFIKPFIFDSSQQLEGAGSCFQITVEPIKCQYSNGDSTNRHLFLTLQRQGAQGKIAGFDMIFLDQEDKYQKFNNTQTFFNVTVPDIFETSSPIIKVDKTILGDFIPKSVKVAIILGTKGSVCPPFSQEIACTKYTYTGRSTNMYDDNVGCTGRQQDLDVFGHSVIDYQCFLNDYYSKNIYADFNRDLTLDQNDYKDFISAFEAGL